MNAERAMNRRAKFLIAFVCLAAALGFAHLALAKGCPFGAPRPPAGGAATGPDGFVGWIMLTQPEFYRSLSSLVRAAKADGSAVWGVLGVSFLYGAFHAAGPGHGKAVITSYLVANDETRRRGVVLSFASALLQALVAVLIVGIAAALLGLTAAAMSRAVRWIEIVSYVLIAALGARLLWVKGRAFFSALANLRAPAAAMPALAAAAAAPYGHSHHGDAAHDHAHHLHALSHGDHHTHDLPHAHQDHAHDHVHDEHCGHSHGPEPQKLAGAGGWRRGLSAIVAVGLRPCSGAILVLVFALAQGLFWAGVAATFVMGLGTALAVTGIATLAVIAKGLAGRLASRNTGYGALALRGLEVAAALLVLAFGVLLLSGYIASERLGMA
jgi:nickel/cobalt exporter